MICLYFPRLNTELAWRRRPALRGRPLAFVQGAGEDAMIVGRSPEAACRGVIIGTRASDARSRVPDLQFAADNRQLAREELGRLAGEISSVTGTPVSIGEDFLVLGDAGVLDLGAAAYIEELAQVANGASGLSCVAGSGESANDAMLAAKGRARRVVRSRAS